ncbi:unnamed protein product [Adineta ricciae]|uniref:Major facilitator superfamily (MFS) profile domain-containing protein n=1 Tax=Adineta ricciae TaxID=249248 RepID=A0A815Y3Y9_ADIRI|nr:unnamed protein product [Adineta ricciae]
MNSNNKQVINHESMPKITVRSHDVDDNDGSKEQGNTHIFAIYPSSLSFENGSTITAEAFKASMSIEIKEVSIYHIRTNRERNIILGTLSMIAFLLPFCDTVYLPALNAITDSLKTSDTFVVISISIYLFMSGLFSLIWGSISDRFGRKYTMIVALTIFVLASIVCIFAPNIMVFIVSRAIEGGAVSSTLVIGQALMTDIYPEEKRGSITGFFFLPFNIGPVIGPLIGGPLSDTFGWRSTFVFLVICSFVVLVAMLIFVPETHQHFVQERFHKDNPSKRIIDAIYNKKPRFEKPWKSLTYLNDLTIIPYIAVSASTFATLYTSLSLSSTYLHQNPYNYSETIIGVLFVPCGVAMFTASLLGGWISDKASNYFGREKCPEGRLVPGLILSTCTPIGLMIYGWTFHYKTHLSGPLIGQILLSFGQAILEPAVSSYLTIKKPEEAAAICAVNTFANFCAAGVILTGAIPLESVIGTGPFFCLMCSINVFTIGFASILVVKCIKRRKHTVEPHNCM